MPVNNRVTVIGGGIAGVSAALRLALSGFVVTLLERTHRLGGRASSAIDDRTGDATDNGQHLAIGAYSDYLETLELLGMRSQLGTATALDAEFCIGSQAHRLNCGMLPGKFGAATGLFAFSGLSIRSKLGIARFAASLRKLRTQSAGMTALELLRSARQTDESIKIFWSPLIVSALNTQPEKASAQLFAEVMRRGFFAKAEASKFIFPRVPLSELLAPVTEIIRMQGGRVLLGTKAHRINFRGGKAVSCTLAGGKEIEADAIVCAAKPKDFLSMLPDDANLNEEFSNLRNLEFSPIVSAYLWSRKPFVRKCMTALPEARIDWVFALPNGTSGLCRTAVTISAATQLIDLKESEIVHTISEELQKNFLEFAECEQVHWRVMKDKHATFCAAERTECFRPSAATRTPNLFVAGDWTQTGLPGTMEGAAASGINAMNLCRNYLILH